MTDGGGKRKKLEGFQSFNYQIMSAVMRETGRQKCENDKGVKQGWF